MNMDNELDENINIMANRLKCVIKSLSANIYDANEQSVVKKLALELAYNINIETQNMFNQK